MNIKSIFLVALSLCTTTLNAQRVDPDSIPPERLSCTSIMVGKKASADGSVMTSHTCDGNYRAWMDIVPGTKYERDTTATVYTGRMHTDHSTGARGMKQAGIVPVKGTTYNFLNTAYPCLNEKQLGIGETTIGGRKELENPKGMFMIEELERLALQQCTTAREAIRLMGDLVKEYGYGDSGECLTIADPDEVWMFEIFGEGPDAIGGVWAAVRIPDDHVGISANISRISKIDLNDPDNYMASDNVTEVAKKMGFWDGKEPFRFWKAYSGTNYFNEPKNFSIREYYLMKKLNSSLKADFDDEELPFSIKPDNKLSVADVMELLTETYEGSEYDMTKNLKVARRNNEKVDSVTSPMANPWMTSEMMKMLNGIKEGTVKNWRTVSVPQCAYSTVIQLRDWLPDDVGGVAWVAFDNPGQSPRIPIFSGTLDLPDCFKVDGQLRHDENAALWAFRRANKLSTLKWGVTRDKMTKARRHFIKKGVSEMPFVESQYDEIMKNEGSDAAREFLTDYTADFAGAAILKWNELGKQFWSMFGRAF